MEGHRGFYFDGQRIFAAIEDEIDFISVRVPVKAQAGILASMDAGFKGFDDDHILEKAAEEWIAQDLFSLFDA